MAAAPAVADEHHEAPYLIQRGVMNQLSHKHVSESMVKPEDRVLRAEMGDSRSLQKEHTTHPSEEVSEALLRRFEFCQKLSYGAYSVVWKVRDKTSRRFVALKKLYQAFRNAEDAQLTYRELMYLHEFRGHENIVHLKELIGDKDSNDLYLTFEYMGADLRAVIAADILSETHRKYVIYQLLRALKALHSAEVIHRDIKPSNILMDEHCHLRLCDLACCRSLSEQHVEGVNRDVLTEYIGTRWYRAPECLLGSQRYGKPVDLWGVGCVLAEMIGGQPLFRGNSTLDQLRAIIMVTGRPTVEDVRSTGSPLAEIIMADVAQPEPTALSELYPEASAESLDMIRMLLQFNPARRIAVKNALRHPYVVDFHNPDDEPNHPRGVVCLPMRDQARHSSEYSRKQLFEDLEGYHIQRPEREYHMAVSYQ